MAIFPWKRNQTLPIWKQPIVDDSAAPFNLTGATVVLRWANADLLAPLVFIPAVNAVTVLDAPNGIVTYQPAPTDVFVTRSGNYAYEWVCTFSNGTAYTDTMAGPTNDS